MSSTTPIFEQTTSVIYYSNDTRLHVVIRYEGERRCFAVLMIPADDLTVDYDRGVEVFRSFDRVKVDAYIAGYDLAIEESREALAMYREVQASL